MAVQHVTITRKGRTQFIDCEIDGHDIRVYDKRLQDAILSGLVTSCGNNTN